MTYLCGHQVCTACGYRQFCAFPVDAEVTAFECADCGEMAARLDSPSWPIRRWPTAQAEIAWRTEAHAIVRRPLFH